MRARQTTMPLSSIKVGRRFRRDLGDLGDLVGSIRDVGVLHPLVVSASGRLIAGVRRLAACRKLRMPKVPVHVVNPTDLLRAEHDENVIRKDFLPTEAVAIGQVLEDRERAAAKSRQGRPGHGRSGKLPQHAKGRAGDRVAAAVGLGRRTYEKAKAIVSAARRDAQYRPLVAQMDRTRRVDKVYRQLRLQEAATERRRAVPAAKEDPNATVRTALVQLTGEIRMATKDLPKLATRLDTLVRCQTYPPRLVGTPGRLQETLRSVEQIQTALHDVLWRGRIIAEWSR